MTAQLAIVDRQNIPIFSAKHRITPQMEAIFADVYKKHVSMEGHSGSLPPTYIKPQSYDTMKELSGRTPLEKALSALQDPMTRKQLRAALGVSDHRAKMIVMALRNKGLIEVAGKVPTQGRDMELLRAIPGKTPPPMTNVSRVIAAMTEPMTNAEISAKTGLELGSVERAIQTLAREKSIEETGRRKGRKVWRKHQELTQ
jgi:predicted HTH transcriptional regulator